ncbi:MAG: hypothetical protein AAGD07_24075 [Planctomycetota bacterium]
MASPLEKNSLAWTQAKRLFAVVVCSRFDWALIRAAGTSDVDLETQFH